MEAKAGDAAMHEWVLLPVASSSRGVPEMALENLSPQAFASNSSTMICQKKGLLQHLICSRSTPTLAAACTSSVAMMTGDVADVQYRCRCRFRKNKPIKASLVLCSGRREKGRCKGQRTGRLLLNYHEAHEAHCSSLSTTVDPCSFSASRQSNGLNQAGPNSNTN